MTNFDLIYSKSNRLVRQCETRDPFKIAAELGIEVMYCGYFVKLKGMYRIVRRNRYIFLNSNMSEQMMKIVCAHELGHDQLHRRMALKAPLQEFVLYDMASQAEYEANLFAANLTLPDDDIIEYIKNGYDLVQIANTMSSDINLVALKTDCLIRHGNNFRAQEHDSGFLK